MDYMLFEVADEQPPRKVARVGTGTSRTMRDERMRERLAEGLEQPIASDNVGFRMLSKMGYRRDQHETIPLAPSLEPQKRAGIGLAETEARSKVADVEMWEATQDEFRSTARDRARYFATRRATRRARHAIQDLDERKGMPRHDLWPPSTTPAENERDESQATTTIAAQTALLRAAVNYLFDEHQFSLSGTNSEKHVDLEMLELIEEELA